MNSTVRTVRTLQAVAVIVGIALFLWSTGLPTIFRFAEAASITNASDTISNSAPSQLANHTIQFTTPNGMLTGQTFTLTFQNTFTMGSVVEGDIDLLVNGVSTSTGAVSGANTWGVTVSGSVITFQTPTSHGVGSTTQMQILIGTNASGGTNRITNPSATTTSHSIDIGGTMQDTGQVRVAITDQVNVSASVNTSLTFTVSGVGASTTVNGSPTTTSATSTSVSLPFGLLGINVSKVLAQDLSVTTNATNGYTVTVEMTDALKSSTGATIDGFIDGSNTVTPTAWQGPSANVTDPATYGHWGLTSTDGTTTRSGPQEFTADKWVSGSTTPIVIMGHTGPADGTTQGYGSARVGYQVQISALQEAGDDYSTTLRYIATPTF